MPPGAALLEIDRVTKRYGALTVADRLSLSVGEREALGVVGPNGAGKTTMFNLITGDVAPNAGRILFAGNDITAMPPHERCRIGIARSYQIPHPFTKMTVFENLLVGAMFGGGQTERASYRRCAEVLELTGLGGKANFTAGALTLLQRKRLELARALVTSPRLLLLDEIGGGLTEHECQELIQTIKAIRGGGVAIVWIEHIVHALLSVVDRLIVINFGEKLAEGEPRDVMADPRVRELYMGIPAA
jgi:branched-chain amino acid transport system ATP-binding protein